MENEGPINSQSKLKTGKEFANELLTADDHEEEEDEYEEDYYGENAYHENGTIEEEQGDTATIATHTSKNLNLKKELSHLKHESHDIILNLSKNTLRNILMLVCDEGVC